MENRLFLPVFCVFGDVTALISNQKMPFCDVLFRETALFLMNSLLALEVEKFPITSYINFAFGKALYALSSLSSNHTQ